MDATAARSIDAVRRFFRAYLRERNPEKTAHCLCEDVRWIGIGASGTIGQGLEAFRALLREEFRAIPGPRDYELRNARAFVCGADCACAGGELLLSGTSPDGEAARLEMRFSAVCRCLGKECRICGIHISMPGQGRGADGFFPASLGETTTAGMSFRSKEQAFELLKNSIPGGLIGGFMEPGFPLYFVNDNLIRHLGYDSYEEFAADIQGMVGNCIHPEDREHVNHVVSESLAVSDHYEVVYRMLAKGGSFIWVLDRGGLTTDRGRKVIVSIVIDITQQRRLQERLQRGMASLERKNAELGAFYQVVVSGIAKILDDPGYTLLYANDQFFDNLGYTREEILSLFNNESLRIMHPVDAAATDKSIRELKEQGRFSVKCRFVKKNGESVRIRLDGCQTSESHDGYNVIYCFYTDIEEQERRDAVYQRQQHFMSLISSSIAGGSFIARAEAGRPLAYVSDSLLSLLGYTRKEFESACGGRLAGIIHPEDRGRVTAACADPQRDYYEEEYRIRKADGNLIWALEKGRLATDEDGEQIYICILLDITDRKLRHDELVQRTRQDPLTGLYNHDYARQYIQTYLDIHQRGHASALLLFDLDNFKRVNDRHGHLEGDAALARFAEILKKQFRSRDFLARTGGDEFIAFLQDIPSEQEAGVMADGVARSMRDSLGREYADCGLALSVGMAFATERTSYNLLFHAADEAMYRMKGKGRDERAFVLDRAEREFERHLLFKHAFGIILRIDLDSGQYHIRYGAHAVSSRLPSAGPYEQVLSDDLLHPVLPEDKTMLREKLGLAQLRAACARGEEVLSREYRVRRTSGETLWIESRFHFLRNEGLNLAYNVISDITESRRQREQVRIAEIYTFTLQDTSDEIYELDMERGRYQTIRSSGDEFLPLPPEGTVEELQCAARDGMIHPDDRERFDRFHYRAREARNGKLSRDEFRCLWRDGAYHWVSISVLPVSASGKVFLVCVMGIDDRKRLENFSSENEQLRQNKLEDERYRIIVEQSRGIVLDIDLERGVHYAPGLEKRFVCDPIAGESPMSMLRSLEIHPDDRPLLDAFHQTLRSRSSEAETTLRLKRRDGAFLWCRIAVTVRRDDEDRPTRIVGVITDVDANIRTLRQLRYRAEHDPVTGYSNLPGFKLDATRLLAARTGRKYALWHCDFRNFKYINDMYGYDVGNRLLKYWADLLAASFSLEETFARSSADNFVLLCTYRDIAEMETRFHNSVELLGHFEELASKRFRVELVGGCYMVEDDDALSLNDMLGRATMAQKSVKHLGGSRYAFYSKAMREKVIYEQEVEASMEKALRNGEFHAWLQPQIDIHNGDSLIGAEVLARWQRPGRGFVPPCDFIPLFERNGFIVDLDAFMFEQACAYLASRRSRGLPPLRLSVNVSRMSLGQKNFLERYTAVRERYAISPGMLELECTESLAVKDFPLFREVMTRLPGCGFRRAMDDFGTGYSSLNLLKNIDLDVLKLDMEFFRNTEGTSRERAVVESVVRMAHALDLTTVAEGIELPEQVDFLRAIGCDAVQGYVFSRPVPLDDFEEQEGRFAAP